jgi:hypothetical protein
MLQLRLARASVATSCLGLLGVGRWNGWRGLPHLLKKFAAMHSAAGHVLDSDHMMGDLHVTSPPPSFTIVDSLATIPSSCASKSISYSPYQSRSQQENLLPPPDANHLIDWVIVDDVPFIDRY